MSIKSQKNKQIKLMEELGVFVDEIKEKVEIIKSFIMLTNNFQSQVVLKDC